MKRPIVSEYLRKEMIRVNFNPNRLDSDVKKLYNKWSRERKKWDKWEKEERDKKYNQKIEDRDIERDIANEKIYFEIYNDLIEEMNNVTEWNIERPCKWDCECCSMRVVLTPKLKHFAKYVCNLCGRSNDWIPYPDLNDIDD